MVSVEPDIRKIPPMEFQCFVSGNFLYYKNIQLIFIYFSLKVTLNFSLILEGVSAHKQS